MTNTAENPAATPSEWIVTLSDNNVLHWKHGNNNVGLLLTSLLDVNGWKGDVNSLVDALPAITTELKIKDLLGIMGALGYRIREEQRNSSDITAEDLPGLFIPHHVTGWHAGWMLREIGPYGLIRDDGRQQIRGGMPVGKGTLYRFERVDAEDGEENPQTQPGEWLHKTAQRFRPIFWHIAALSLVMHLFTLSMPLFSMAVYDRVIGAHAPGSLPLFVIGVLTALLMEKVIRWTRVRGAGWVGARSGLIVSQAMFERLLFLPASLIEHASVSAQLARLRAFESVRDFVTGPMFLTLLEMPFIGVLVLVIAWLGGPVAFVSIGITVLYILLLLGTRPRWRRLGQDSAHSAARRQQILMDIIDHVQPIYAAGMSERMMQRFATVSWQAVRLQHAYAMTASTVQYIAGMLTVAAGLLTISMCLDRIWSGEMTAGAMVAIMILTWRVLYPLQALCTILPHLEQIQASVRQVSQLMAMKPEAHAMRHALAERKLEGKISFQSVSMRYGRKSDPIFLNLNAEIQKGQIVAVYGGNGSGKSTVLRMLLGLYPPSMGVIRFDGVDHRQFDPRALRRQISYLPQASELLPGTIAENLRTVDALAPDYRLRQALLWADAWELVDEMPAGLNTKLYDGGVVPSSSLAARLCLTRLYLADRPIVLADELPLSLLNSSTGERFRSFLEECRGQRTVIFVTHREEMLALADQVIWMKPGGVPVVGQHGQNPAA